MGGVVSSGGCCVVDVGFHEMELAISLHRQWLEDRAPLNSSLDRLSGETILRRYLSGMRRLRDSIASQLVTYDIHAMIVSIAMLWTVR